MSVIDLPPGDWTPILVGDQWPNSASLQSTLDCAENRAALVSELDHYADVLVQIRHQSLAPQEGITAEEIRGDFERGIAEAQRVADVNRAKSKSYSAAHNAISEFRIKLGTLAAEGNRRIDAVNQSKQPLPEKVTAILTIVSEMKSRAAVHAAICAADISNAIQNVLTVQGIDVSPQTFADTNGVPSIEAAANADELKEQIIRKLGMSELKLSDDAPSSTNTPTPAPAKPSQPSEAEPRTMGTTHPRPDAPSDLTELPGPSTPTPAPAAASGSNTSMPAVASMGPATTTSSPTTAGSNTPTPAPAISSASGKPVSPSGATAESVRGGTKPINTNAITPSAASAPNASFSVEDQSVAAAPGAAAPAIAHGPNALSDLAENFNTGNQSGAPVSSGAEAISTAAASPVHTAPNPLSPPLPETSSRTTHVFETAHATAATAPQIAQIAPTPTEATPLVAAPPPLAAPTITPPPLNASPLTMPPPTPPSSLLGYGADLRPPVATPAAAPLAPSTNPVSAPLHTPGGSTPNGHPALLRQPVAPASQLASSAGITERAVAATATGAAAGAITAGSTAATRLRRLLHAVARQQPQLGWAIGDLDDGSTLLLTDVASGWIPPNIDIPTGVTLLPPADRRGDLTALLGPARRTAIHLPGQHVPTNQDATPVAVSIRSRDVTNLDDLGWELAQATKWRDGLPRLAHTLAKAVTAQTGWLDSEASLLRDHLCTVAQSVIAAYPEHIDSDRIANWQLLATIDALISNQQTLANYHFAWFRAHTLTREARR